MNLYVDNLTIEWGGRLILANMSFTLAAGHALVIEGENGSGKTSLLRAIAGLLSPTRGSIRFENEAAYEEQIYYLGHESGLTPALTVVENLRFWASVLGGRGASIPSALARFGLAHAVDLPVRVLSAGQKRKVALAGLLVAHRPLWLLDEPTAALNSTGQVLVANMCADHLQQGGYIVATTHIPLGFPATILRLGS